MSNLNIAGYLGGVLCIPDAQYQAFLDRYVADIQAGAPQYFTETRGPIFRFYVDLDIERPTELSVDELDIIARACHASAARFLPDESTHGPRHFRAIVCTADPDSKGDNVKTGVHIIMPELIVDKERALDMRAALVVELSEHMPDTSLDFWRIACDTSVYNDVTSGLRMLGSSKLKTCGGCNNDKKKCHLCGYTGRQRLGRPYGVHAVYDSGVRNEVFTAKMQKSFALAIKHCSIRVAAAEMNQPRDLHPEWHRFTGCPSREAASKARTESQALTAYLKERTQQPPGRDESSRKKTAWSVICKMDHRVGAMLQMIHRLDPAYARVQAKKCSQSPDGMIYSLQVDGHGSCFCLNKKADHGTSKVYFMFYSTDGGRYQQRCWSRKQNRLGMCSDWASDKRRIMPSEFKTLWPDYEKLKRVHETLPKASSKKARKD